MRIVTTAARHAFHESGRQRLLLANSITLAATGIASAALGFLFWWFAARYFPPRSVGLAAAAISIMNLIALIGEFGLGSLLLGESLRRGREAPGLISAALLAAFGLSALFGAACLVIADLSQIRLESFLDSLDHRLLFIAGCAVAGFALVLDSALIGLLRNALRAYRNVAFSFLKLALLPTLAFAALAGAQEITIFLAWVLGMLLSILLLAPFLAFRGHAVWTAPNFPELGRQGPSVLGHHFLDLVTQGPGLLLPFLVTVFIAADANAAFYASWMLFTVVLLVPASLTTMIFTIGSSQPDTVPERIRFSLCLCALTGLGASVGFYFLSDWMLGWFGASYAALGAPVLQILGLAVLAIALKSHYIAVQRLRGRMVAAAMLLGVGGLVELALAVWGAKLGGLAGFTLGWVCAIYLEAVVIAPTVLRAARGERSPGRAARHRAPPFRLDHGYPHHGYSPRAGRARTSILNRRGQAS